jgi:potassium-transporting ATPase KdpC subunit
MWNELKAGFLMMVALTVITGLVYPAVITLVAQVFFKDQANGSLVSVNGQLVGSRLIGQSFTKREYFHPRPSSAGSNGYDPTASAGSNLGPTSAKLFNGTTKVDDKTKAEVVDFDGFKDRLVHYCVDNDIPYESSKPLDGFKDAKGDLDDVKLIKAFNDDKSPLVFVPKSSIPADAVTGSASGLDPDISPANADLQAARVAEARGGPIEQVKGAIAAHTTGRTFGILGEPTVNVLELNLALDEQFRKK